MTWETVACCDECWPTLEEAHYGNGELREPMRFIQEWRREEFCHFCGWTTYSGIYIRTDAPAAPLRVRREPE